MLCYQCGCPLSEHDFCTSCGADVTIYKKIMYTSNMFYNDGLEKAKVRDLTGAVNSLRQSLKLNKNHIEARNLLGLVYFEMGEVVAALSEWVISKNLRPKKNIAGSYINMVQSNASRLETINQTIKKYNQSYYYCTQGSKDLAIIQLKKVLSMNPRFIRAHQLLALLYIDSEQWERARRELKKCLDIDRNNTIALRYLQEVDAVFAKEDASGNRPRAKRDDTVRYQSDNEVIIQPMNVKEPRKGSFASLINIGIGLVIGLAAMYFLVVPSLMADVRGEENQKVLEIGSQLDEKSATIVEMQRQMEALEGEKDKVEQELQGYVGSNGTLETIDNFLDVVSAYLEGGDVVQTGAALEDFAAKVEIDQMSQAVRRLYQAVFAAIGPELGTVYYDAGTQALKDELYGDAIANLEKSVFYDAGNVEALYELGNAYRESGDVEKALEAYQKLLELFPDSNRVKRAQRYVDDLSQD